MNCQGNLFTQPPWPDYWSDYQHVSRILWAQANPMNALYQGRLGKPTAGIEARTDLSHGEADVALGRTPDG